MKRIFVLICLIMLLCLVACGKEECREHQWNAAACDRPATCAVCGITEGTAPGHQWLPADCDTAKTCEICHATEGEALGHSWQDATCETASICSVCSAVSGEALGHDWLPANYQAPATCRTCAATDGECLRPGFAAYGVNVISVQLGVQYDYLADCYVQGYTTLGKLWWDDYQIFASDETHAAVEGYVWHSVTVHISFSDRNAQKYGIVVQTALDDYYWYSSQTGNGYTDQFTVSYYGQLYDRCLRANGQGSVSEWVDNACVYTATFAWRVPVDYDGHMILFYSGAGDLADMLQKGDEGILVFKFE